MKETERGRKTNINLTHGKKIILKNNKILVKKDQKENLLSLTNV